MRLRALQGLTETFAGAVEGGREQLEASRALHHGLDIRIGEGRATVVLGISLLMAGEPARDQLAARGHPRAGSGRHRWELLELVAFMGLGDVLPE